MLTILTTTNYQQKLANCINTIDRLMELITITIDKNSISPSTNMFIVNSSGINSTIDWNDTEPPYLFPTFPYSENNLLALIFYKLGNHQKAFEILENDSELFMHFSIATNLQFGYTITNEHIVFLENTSKHNLAIVYNLAELANAIDQQVIQNTYELALKVKGDDSHILFTAKYYINFLIDSAQHSDAEKLIRSVKQKAISLDEKNALTIYWHLL